jgi:hypothetical protein
VNLTLAYGRNATPGQRPVKAPVQRRLFGRIFFDEPGSHFVKTCFGDQ